MKPRNGADRWRKPQDMVPELRGSKIRSYLQQEELLRCFESQAESLVVQKPVWTVRPGW